MATLDRDKALDMALAQIDKQFGKGSVMRLGDSPEVAMKVIPTAPSPSTSPWASAGCRVAG